MRLNGRRLSRRTGARWRPGAIAGNRFPVKFRPVKYERSGRGVAGDDLGGQPVVSIAEMDGYGPDGGQVLAAVVQGQGLRIGIGWPDRQVPVEAFDIRGEGDREDDPVSGGGWHAGIRAGLNGCGG